ncbi:HNH endonuclease [Butyrivibrio sp. AD3002]|uniref:HNH endonuclease n=1 Tax=Butyrivibrio sp. AD3002 TaxID=1280670 RepID=UPI0003B34C79|nr:HNH endonuclease signature motif containing protein [Butyrivibrio sp. AD3002]
MNVIEQFKKERVAEDIKRSDEAYKLIYDFQKDFPLENIKALALDDYLYVPYDEYNPSQSFCSRIWRDMNSVSSKGNVRPNMFGIYTLNNKIEIFGKYLEPFGDDVDAAFTYLKKEMYNMLVEVGKDNYEAVKACEINRAFRYKLLEIYYPDKFIHVHTEKTLNEYCDRIGISYDPKEEQVYRNLALKEWKDSVPEFSGWNNSLFMSFCVWLCHNNIKFDGSSYVVKDNASKAKKIDEEICETSSIGEVKEAIVKVRVNQGIFRDLLLRKSEKCCLCGVSNKNLLIASHIKPWSDSTPEEKLHVENGLLMCPNHDKLFDQGWISFDDEGKIIISEQLGDVDRMYMNVNPNFVIEMTDSKKKYMQYHRENVFKG